MNDSTDEPAGQRRSAPVVVSSSLAGRLGPTLLAQGFVAAPVALLRGYTRLGLSDGELALILQIWSYWREDALPCPAVGTLAVQLGKTERQVQQIAAGLRQRGLLTVRHRHGGERGQLSNEYDLAPLLRALEALQPVAVRPEVGVLTAAGGAVQPLAEGGMQAIAPNEDHQVRSLVLVSDSPLPPIQPELPVGLSEQIDRIGKRLGDAAPNSSRTRAARLLASCELDADVFGARLDQAAKIALGALPLVRRRGPAGTPNGMPYYFAVLAAMVEERPEPSSPASTPPLRSVLTDRACRMPAPTHIPSERAPDPREADVDSTGHSLWPAVVDALADWLAPRVLAQRVSPLRSRTGNDGALEVVAEDQAAARWLEARLGRRIQEALDLVALEPPAWRIVVS